MDDILKRMMKAEAKADELLKETNAECEALLSEARSQAGILLADARKKLAAEADEYMKSCLEKAQGQANEALRKGDESMKGELLGFEKRFSRRLNEVADLLLYPEAD